MDEEDDEEQELPQESQAGIWQEEVDRLVSDMVRYVLFKNFQQPGVPVKRDELIQIVTKSYRQRGLAGAVIKKAEKMLKSVFGMELYELDKLRHHRGRSAAATSADPVKEYVLKTTVPGDLRQQFVDEEQTNAFRGLTVAVVGIVYLSGLKCTEENLWLHLQKLGLDEHDEKHPMFGNVRQAVEGLLKQRYIQKEKSAGDDYIYTLAEKALDDQVFERSMGWISELVKQQEKQVEEEEDSE